MEKVLKKNIEEGIKYIKKSADQGYHVAISFYSNLLYLGIINQTDKDELNKYMKIAGEIEDDKSPLLYSLWLLKNNNNTNDNKRKIEKYLKKFADKGNPGSMYLYGWILYNENYKEKAAYYLKKSAELNYTFSMHLYGKMLLEGDGVEKNKKEAASLYKMAADDGHYLSMFQYGKMLLKGIGVKANKTEAYEYIQKSFGGTNDLKIRYLFSISSTINITFNIDFPKDMAIKNDKNYYKEMFKYGNNLLNDKNNSKDGICFIFKASRHDINEALFKIGKIYYKGDLLHQDKKRALNYFSKSANLHNILTLFYMGLMIFSGDGVNADKVNGAYYIFVSLEPIIIIFELELLMFVIYKKIMKNSNSMIIKPCPIRKTIANCSLNQESLALKQISNNQTDQGQ